MKLQGPAIYTEEECLHQQTIVIENGRIAAITSDSHDALQLPTHWHIVPGMIDMHIHGVKGADVMDATPNALQKMATTLPEHGTTAFLASTMTMPMANIEAAIKNVACFPNQTGAEILGLHLEGPFLSAKKMGAQRSDCILKPDVTLMKQWCQLAPHKIKMVTLAPEIEGAFELIHYLCQHNIIAAIGHTDADFATTQKAIAHGCTQATHLFNAMSGLHHRTPGAALALLLDQRVHAEIIADNIHVHEAMLELTYRLKGAKHIILITDAMRACCLGEGDFDLAGLHVTVKNKMARLQSGALAGSVTSLCDAALHMQKTTHCSLHERIQMTASNPARALNIFERKGSIAPGKDADLVILDEEYRVRMTICRGVVAFSKL